MISIQTKAHIGADGTLSVHLPTILRDTDVDVMLVVQPVAGGTAKLRDQVDAEDLGYPDGFFEETFGSFKDNPLERLPQGEFEQREALS